MQSTSPDIDFSAADQIELTRPPKGLWRETLERLIRKPSAVVGLVMLGTLVIVAIFAPVIATHNPLTCQQKASPSAKSPASTC
jgi:ABC-type dipeptide/oligopeptide/nickel transport system permease subunit